MKKLKRQDAGATVAPKRSSEIRVAKKVYGKSVARQLLRAVGYTLLGLFVIYWCFAVTIMRVLPPSSSLGATPVKNLTYPGGLVPHEELVVVDLINKQGDGVVDRLRQSLLPNPSAAVVRVKAGPTGSVSWTPGGLVTVDGKNVGVSLAKDPGKYLVNQYVGECLQGACRPGNGVIFSQENILGVPLDVKGADS